MKVKLTGISPYDPEIDGKDYKYYTELLKQIPFPIIVNADSEYPHVVNLKQYIKEERYPESVQIWGLMWFTYEEVKEN